jgi:hypothetical protein
MGISPSLELAAKKYLQQFETTDTGCVELHAANTSRFPFMTTAEYIYGSLTDEEKEELWALGQRNLVLMGHVLSGGVYRFKLYQWLRPETYRRFKRFERDWCNFNERIVESRRLSHPLPPIVDAWKAVDDARVSKKEVRLPTSQYSVGQF